MQVAGSPGKEKGIVFNCVHAEEIVCKQIACVSKKTKFRRVKHLIRKQMLNECNFVQKYRLQSGATFKNKNSLKINATSYFFFESLSLYEY